MSKSAIKSLNRANGILAELNLTVGVPADWMKDAQARANFKNADVLACLIVNSAANALQCETVDTLDENLYDNMQQAVEGYIHSNLDDWNQKEWPASCRDIEAELDRLVAMVKGQFEYMNRQAAHAEALEVNEAVDQAVNVATYFSGLDSATPNAINLAIDHIRSSLLGMNRYTAQFIVKMMVSVRRLAKLARVAAQDRYAEMMARPVVEGVDSEIPF